MKREDLRIGQMVEVNMIGVVTGIGVYVGVKATNNSGSFDDIQALAQYVAPFTPDAKDEEVLSAN